MTLHMATFSIFFILVSIFLCSEAHPSHLTSHESTTTSGFSLDLIHREASPLSPFYNPLATHSERLKNAIHRSHSRLSHFQSKCRRSRSRSSGSVESDIHYDSGEYLMKLLIGTPPVETLGIADTGSDLTWIQCKPCKRCFEHINPLFDLRASSSYKTLKCTSKQCKAFQDFSSTCTREHNKCQYHVVYGDGSYSQGHLATETLTFGNTSIEKLAFGCGHYNRGIFGNTTSGIIGLGGGPLSLISQLKERIQGKFSYCLVSIFKNETSTINFGEQAPVLSSKVVSTPLFPTPDVTFYYLYLEKVIIGNKSFEVPREEDEERAESGNIIIDSGTTLTYLPGGEFYNGIVSTLKEAMGVKTIDYPDGNFKFCYKTNSKIKAPVIAFQFKNATIEIPQSSTFVEVDDGVTCFTVVPSGMSIFGNILQENFMVSYDLQNKKVSFQATDCSKKL
ncbi:aspartic proteinase CDR1-like [Heracleum sosnowskyi]|uniref:Aspartic proteinase CDR1-like n=1 Tax=Heracleum sosnowskyi TaxID=360622 RepID=A0AAD8JFU4_9APIA|nr:aspartic proteinase CDR1-like [Heracleum sosnowskyi]